MKSTSLYMINYLRIFNKNIERVFRRVINDAKSYEVNKKIISSNNIAKISWDIIGCQNINRLKTNN